MAPTQHDTGEDQADNNTLTVTSGAGVHPPRVRPHCTTLSIQPEVIDMAIANAVERGPSVYLYDEKGRVIRNVPARDGLVSFTATTVSVRVGNMIHMYNERGQFTGSAPAR